MIGQKLSVPTTFWTTDFVHDQLAIGYKFRVLTIVDTFSRYVPTLDPRSVFEAKMSS